MLRPDKFNFLFSNVILIKGIGEKTIKLLQKLIFSKKDLLEGEKNVRMVDLLYHLPEKILKRKFIKNFLEIEAGGENILKLTVIEHKAPQLHTKRPFVVVGELENGSEIDIVFYKVFENYINSRFKLNSKIIVSGKIESYNNRYQLVHPDFAVPENQENLIPLFEAIYPLTAGLFNKELVRYLDEILSKVNDLGEWLSDDILKIKQWDSWKVSLVNLHKPKEFFDVKNNSFIYRLAFDELLAEQLALNIVKSRNTKEKIDKNLIKGTLQEYFIKEKIAFELTEDQQKVLAEITEDTFSDKKMMRLLQGDVGSGKTIVAFLSALHYIENRKQVSIMVPTSILASQHFENIKLLCEKDNLKVELLTGKIKGKKREKILEDLKNGAIDILIGTHALIEDNVEFKELAFVVIDEQHRFGVEQRLKLIKKNKNIDILSMTATPIPRTLSLTIYNDMDLSVIKTKPKNRKEIITSSLSIDKYELLLQRVKEKIKFDEKIYWICPLIEESEKIDLSNVEDKYKELSVIFGAEKISCIHGRMKQKEKDDIMEDFSNNNEKKILIATTVVEVGVDIKNATIIIVEHPERFGLSQLHQLRGRVGRGDRQSYCIFLYNYDNITKNSIKRMDIMKNTNDGFLIAEEDLKIRGIGEVLGLKQSGEMDYKIADLNRDFYLLQEASVLARKIVAEKNIKQYIDLLFLFNYINYLDRDLIN